MSPESIITTATGTKDFLVINNGAVCNGVAYKFNAGGGVQSCVSVAPFGDS